MRRPVSHGPARGLLAFALALGATAACGGGSSNTASSGSLYVVVTDLAGTPVAGATVTTMPATQSLSTDALGTAFFAKVAPGGYAVTALHPTVGSGRVTGEVTANEIERLAIALSGVSPTGQGGAAGRPGPGGAAGGGVAGAVGTGGVLGAGGTIATGGTGGRGGTAGTGGATGTGGTGGAAGAGGSGPSVVLAVPTKDQGGINLSWTCTPASAFATFRIYRNSTLINILQDGTSVQYRDTTAQAGVSYTYQVGGVTSGGVETRSNAQTILAGVYIDVGSQIERMMVDPKRPYLYGIDKVNNSLHFINVTTNTVDKTIFVGSSPTDLDINLEGTTLYIANFGSTEIAMVDLDTQTLAGTIFVDTTVGTWGGNPYRLACTTGDTLVFTSMDQWNSIKLVNALTGASMDNAGSLYEPDLAASPDGTSLYVGEYGGLNGVTRFDIVNGKLQSVDSSSASGTASIMVTRDDQYVFYSAQKLLAKNLKSVVGTFSETILAINADGSIAVGANHIFDATTFAVKRTTPVSTSTMAISTDGSTLYLYDITSSRIYLTSLN